MAVKLYNQFLLALICLNYINLISCACDYNNFRVMSVEACSHLKKRDVDLNDYYNVEHIYSKDSVSHEHVLARKLTHQDFPEGAYLLVKNNIYSSEHRRNSESINLIREDDDEERTNEIFDESYQNVRNHKNRHSFRFRRNVEDFKIEQCCSKEKYDMCKRIFCH